MATFPFILLLFVLLTLIFSLAWCGYYRTSRGLFLLFLIAFTLVFIHHVSDSLSINL